MGAPPTERELLDRARTMRNNPTEWEKRPWRLLSHAQPGGLKFRRQAVLAPWIVDFFCPAKGLAIEIDGRTHDEERDGRRDAGLAHRGFAVLRFTNADARDDAEGVVARILTVLGERPDRWAGRPHPNPSPEGEGLA